MSRSAPPQDNAALLRVLSEGGLDFVVIGGVAAVLHGSSRVTVDLDICISFDDANLQRLLRLLAPYKPVHASRPDLSLLDEPPERLRRFRLFLIRTSLGRLDVLRRVEPLGEHGALDTVEIMVAGLTVKVISRPQLIEVKRFVGRPKDREVALELELAEEEERPAPKSS